MKNRLMKKEDSIVRILDVRENKVLIIDCIKKTMPVWYDISSIFNYEICPEDELSFAIREEESLSASEKRIMHERYTLIAGILLFVSDEKLRSTILSKIAEQYNVSKQTIRKYLCLYLVYQDMSVYKTLMEMNGSIHDLLAIPTNKNNQKRYLRYCPCCLEVDRNKYGETYWHRIHQMIDVDICPIHSELEIDVDEETKAKVEEIFKAFGVGIDQMLFKNIDKILLWEYNIVV